MNRPKLKRLKGYIKNGMNHLVVGEGKEHADIMHVLIHMENILYELIEATKELDERMNESL